MIKNLVVGVGLSGAVIAERLAKVLNEPVLIIDRRNHIGGNAYDYRDTCSGIMVHRYGPHVFHTNDKSVWDYLSTFTEWGYFMLKVKSFIDGQEVPLAFNLNSLHQVFPKNLAIKLEGDLIKKFGFNKKVPILELRKSKELSFLANYIYEKIFLGYTLKQWGIKPEDLDPSVTGRIPIYISHDNRYFQDKYQGIPINGYTEMIKKMLSSPLIEVKLNTSWESIKNDITYERLFFTGPIDEFFEYRFGALPYRSLDIVFRTYQQEYYQSTAFITFPENYDFTRSCEYKYFLNEKSNKTVVSFEYPQAYIRGKNEPYYPIPSEKNEKLYMKYQKLADIMDNVYFLGRLGNYKYYNMDQVVKNTLEFFEKLKSNL